MERYRAPELLYSARRYDEGVDLWAVGCIFGEMLNNSPLFPGDNDIQQLCRVLSVLGTPNETTWPGLTELPDYNKISFSEFARVPFEELVPDASPDAVDLLSRFLVYDSKARLSAREALLHRYFFRDPLPAHHSELPIPSARGNRRSMNVRRRRFMSEIADFDVDAPLDKTLVDPRLLAPYAKVYERRTSSHGGADW